MIFLYEPSLYYFHMLYLYMLYLKTMSHLFNLKLLHAKLPCPALFSYLNQVYFYFILVSINLSFHLNFYMHYKLLQNDTYNLGLAPVIFNYVHHYCIIKLTIINLWERNNLFHYLVAFNQPKYSTEKVYTPQ